MEQIKLPAYKRGKSGERYKYTFTITDSYEEYSQINGKFAIDKKLYINILKTFFWELSRLIITKRYHFKIPNRLGFLRIKKNKNFKSLNKNKLDFAYYHKTGKKRYWLNTHTDGQYFYWGWETTKFRYGQFTNKSYYVFIPNRGNDDMIGKRGLSQWIIKCANDPRMKDYDVI